MSRRPAGLAIVLVLALSAAGCASGPELSDEPTVELVVHNERVASVTAFVEWEGYPAARLGEIGAGRSVTYLPPFRSGVLCVTFLGFGNTSFSTTVPDRRPRSCGPRVPVERGERMDVTFRQDGPICYLQYDPDC